MNKKCSVCTRRACVGQEGFEYCEHHEKASANLKKNYPAWELAYGSILWERYLESISKLSESGDWVREVAIHELELAKKNNISK